MGELSLIAPPILFRNKPAGKSSKINGFGRLRRRCLGEGRRRLSCEYDEFRGCEGPEILRAFGYFYLNTSRYFYFGIGGGSFPSFFWEKEFLFNALRDEMIIRS